MNLKLIAEIAKALLLARWKQSLVAAVGVMFSITMFIALLGFMNGLNGLLDGMMLNRTPHVRLYNDIKPNPDQPMNHSEGYKEGHNFIRSIKSSGGRVSLYDNAAIMQAVKADPRVMGIAPKITAPVLYNAGTIDITGTVSGIDVEAENRLFSFDDYMSGGKAIDLKNVANSIILGQGVADKLLAEIGDVIQVTTSKGERLPLKVVGFYQTGFKMQDDVQSYASIATAQKLLGESNSYITDIQVKLHDLTKAPVIATEYAKRYNVEAVDIQTANADFETGSSIRSLISYVVGVVLLIVAGFGIYNILNMMIYEKMDTIAILKATGFSGSDVRKVFLGIAITIGIIGGMSGLFFGFLVSLLIDQVPFKTAALPTVTTYPIDYNPVYYTIGIIFSLITTYLAGFFPARKASRVDPVVIIRGK